MPNFSGITQRFGQDPLGTIKGEVDKWGNKIMEPFGGSMPGTENDPLNGGQYNLTPQDQQQAFLDTNPQMRPEYSQGVPSWIQRLKQRLAQGGQIMHGAMGGPQQQQQMPQAAPMDSMSQRSAALQGEYNRGSQMGQATRNVAGMFGLRG